MLSWSPWAQDSGRQCKHLCVTPMWGRHSERKSELRLGQEGGRLTDTLMFITWRKVRDGG